jgi:hypothetical protein
MLELAETYSHSSLDRISSLSHDFLSKRNNSFFFILGAHAKAGNPKLKVGIGAGHDLPACMLEETLLLLGVKSASFKSPLVMSGNRCIIDSMNVWEGADTGTKITTIGYPIIQSIEQIRKMYDWLVHETDIELLRQLARNAMLKTATKHIDKYLPSLRRLPKDKEIVLMATHGYPASVQILIARVLQKEGRKVSVIEYVQDPAFCEEKGLSVATMISPITCDNHYVIVNNRQAGETLKKVLPHRNIYALGTVSIPYNIGFIPNNIVSGKVNLRDWKERWIGDQIEQLIERNDNHFAFIYSGNYNSALSEKMRSFIKHNLSKILSGEIKITIHAMHHQLAIQNALAIMNEYKELENNKNFQLIWGDSYLDAIKLQIQLLAGLFLNGSPSDVFCSGGEKVNMADNYIRYHAVTGIEHEKRNATIAEQYHHGINLINIPPEEWFDLIAKEKQDYPQKPPRENLANFAFFLLNPSYREQLSQYLI